MDYPEDYELYTRDDAVEMVRDRPNDFDLYDEEDMQESYKRGREEMLEEILGNPEEYGLLLDEIW